ncbi:hypothetical protein AVME950_20760 [Acidovorax sp. SUPP950]|uniref:hypothetical protein n=1 Tax=Acidovorax sp. SUPP950 TaxID=511901 RepID=UPI0023D683D1|nr:hypothetical protein [Acidovorax sp. SUPP950]GKS77370.1 hypothetical protein AVME950_20760 [Acidovorax sp. SUPP950]
MSKLLVVDSASEVTPATEDDINDLWSFLAIAAYEADGFAARKESIVAAHLKN